MILLLLNFEGSSLYHKCTLKYPLQYGELNEIKKRHALPYNEKWKRALVFEIFEASFGAKTKNWPKIWQ